MQPSFQKYRSDLDVLIARGDELHLSMPYECRPAEILKAVKKAKGDDADKLIKSLPKFRSAYQAWYSESLALIRQVLPDRLSDFIRHYEKPKGRKQLSNENYVIEDYLQGLVARFGGEVTADTSAALSRFEQQLNILRAVTKRFESSLFDVKQLVQADLFDSELEAANELVKGKYFRAAGIIAGVVLERHLVQVCENHGITSTKRHLTISDLSERLKSNDVVDLPQWRFIQHLADIRNICAHNKDREPTPENIDGLIAGVGKITKTLF